jgi:hypothetical protein
LAKFALGKRDVEGDVQRSEEVVVLVVGHALALLADSSSGPGDLVSGNGHFVAVLMKKNIWIDLFLDPNQILKIILLCELIIRLIGGSLAPSIQTLGSLLRTPWLARPDGEMI